MKLLRKRPILEPWHKMKERNLFQRRKYYLRYIRSGLNNALSVEHFLNRKDYEYGPVPVRIKPVLSENITH